MLQKELRCPYCGRINDRHGSVHDDVEPAPGDLDVCWSCRQIAAFTDDLDLRTLEGEELRVAYRNNEVRAALQAGLMTSRASEALRITRALEKAQKKA